MRRVLQRLVGLIASRGGVGLVVLALLLALRVWDPVPVEELRLRGFDFYQRISPRIPSLRPVVIVDIDEASIAAYGQWPWPRTMIADMVRRLTEWEVAAIAFDVIFPEPDRSSPDQAARHFRGLDEPLRRELGRLPANDAILAAAIKEGRVVLGRAGAQAFQGQPSQAAPETSFATLGPDPRPYLVGFPRILRNLPELEQAAAGRGLFSIRPESDGMVRRVPIVMQAGEDIYPALTLELLRVVSGSGAVLIRSDAAGVRGVAVPGLELPTDQHGRVWVHFSAYDKSRYVSARDIIEGRAAPDDLRGKLVLLGTSAIGLLDVKTTPVHASVPGVEVHAQVLESALTGALLTAPGIGAVLEMTAALIAGLLIALIAPGASAFTLFLVAALLVTALAAASWVLFVHYQLLLDATFPILATLAVYIAVVLIGYFREQMDRRRIRFAFAQYLSPSLVEQLADSPEKLVLGGETRVMTVLFSDVRGFTTISEAYKDDPQGLTRLMNRFLTPLTNAIVARQGTIDKYMGDAVMAFWNAPLDDPDHQLNACRAARDMLERVEKLNRVREKEAAAAGTPFIPIKMGIGINTGPCAVGNMGSDLRFQYTVMGDSVNLASRIEGLTKDFGVSIILGARTAQAVAGDFAVLEIDSIRVKGKTEPETIYTLMGGPEMLQSNEHRELEERWAAFLASWRKQDWAGARQAMSRCRSLCIEAGLGGVLDLYADRLRQLGQGALPGSEEPRPDEAPHSAARAEEPAAAQAQLAKPEVITSS